MSSEEAQAAALAQAEKLIPSTVRMISGCRDEQTSADGMFRSRCCFSFGWFWFWFVVVVGFLVFFFVCVCFFSSFDFVPLVWL